MAPRPSDSFLSDAAWAGQGPPGGLLGRCASGAKLLPPDTADAPSVYTALGRLTGQSQVGLRKGSERWLGGEGYGQEALIRANQMAESFDERC